MTNVQTVGTPGKTRLTSESKGMEFIAPYVPMPVELDCHESGSSSSTEACQSNPIPLSAALVWQRPAVE